MKSPIHIGYVKPGVFLTKTEILIKLPSRKWFLSLEPNLCDDVYDWQLTLFGLDIRFDNRPSNFYCSKEKKELGRRWVEWEYCPFCGMEIDIDEDKFYSLHSEKVR